MVFFNSHNNPELPDPDGLEEPRIANTDEIVDAGERGGYEGYELLGNGDMDLENLDDDDDDSESENEFRMDEDNAIDENGIADPEPPLAESEIEAEVWNAPRPEELSIPLDSTKTEQILNVMANIKLPQNAIPEWGISIPEEQWKKNLLEKIRARGGPQNPSDSSK